MIVLSFIFAIESEDLDCGFINERGWLAKNIRNADALFVLEGLTSNQITAMDMMM